MIQLLGKFRPLTFRRRQDWDYSVYGCDGLKEELPAHMPTPLGKTMRMHVYVDSDHAGDSLTRRSRTGFVVFLNSAPIFWFSKRQTSCETSTFGSEFIAMKTACDYVRGLRYKLRMMGIRVDEPTYIYGDNQSVLANTSNVKSRLGIEVEVCGHRVPLCARRGRVVNRLHQHT